MTDPTQFRWPPVTKDPGDDLPTQLGLWALCAQFWAPNEQYDTGDFVWPRITVLEGQIVKGPNGCAFECTQAGRSGAKEPRWLVTPDVAMPALDGTVQWTPRVGALQGVNAASSPQVLAIVPSDGVTNDLTTSQPIINEGTKLLVDYLGGTDGLSYEIQFAVTIGGRQRIGRQQVNVVKK